MVVTSDLWSSALQGPQGDAQGSGPVWCNTKWVKAKNEIQSEELIMKGIVVDCLKQLVVGNFGADKWAEIAKACSVKPDAGFEADTSV